MYILYVACKFYKRLTAFNVLRPIRPLFSSTITIILCLSLCVHADTCDPTWQSSRDGLVISAHIFSDISLLIFVAAGIYFAIDYISKG